MSGAVPWQQAWEAALYGPQGFYRSALPGRHFRTSVHASPLFAEAVLRLVRAAGLDTVVDLGAGAGELLVGLRSMDPELRLIGVEIRPRPEDLPADVHWTDGLPAVDGLVATALELMGGDTQMHDAEHVFVDGASRVASSFDAVETVREILGILEQQLVVVSLLRDVMSRGLTVAIGTETGMQPLEECALVVSPYSIGGVPAGTIGVLGPTRMDYPQALAAVALVSQRLSARLTEG